MKMKVIIILFALILLSSCSNDTPPINDNNVSDTLVPSDSYTNIGESSIVSNSINDIQYVIISADWPVYSSVGDLVAAGNLIVMGRVTDISFEILDHSTGKPATPSSKKIDRCFSTIYDIDVTNCYKGTVSDQKMQVRISSGIKDAYIEEQLKVLDDDTPYIPVVPGTVPKIDIGKTYLFVLRQYKDYIPTVVNMDQGVYSLDTPFEKDILSISLKDILDYFGEEVDAIRTIQPQE